MNSEISKEQKFKLNGYFKPNEKVLNTTVPEQFKSKSLEYDLKKEEKPNNFADWLNCLKWTTVEDSSNNNDKDLSNKEYIKC